MRTYLIGTAGRHYFSLCHSELKTVHTEKRTERTTTHPVSSSPIYTRYTSHKNLLSQKAALSIARILSLNFQPVITTGLSLVSIVKIYTTLLQYSISMTTVNKYNGRLH